MSVRTEVRRGPAAPSDSAAVTLRPVGPGQVQITGGLWYERAEANSSTSIPGGLERLREAGNLENFAVAAGSASGTVQGPVFADSDVYKWLEAAAWEYGRTGDETLLADQLEVTGIVARAQASDGYLDSVVEVREHERYRDLPWSHEHYCAGHLIQAAVAQVRATGHRDLLDVAIRLADHLVATFGPGGREDIDGHPLIEMALVELYRETAIPAYLDLARHFVDARGRGVMAARSLEPTYFSDRVPVREATTVEGHAVRAVYLASGAADVAIETGDSELLVALRTQYDAMEGTKQYLTGGLGARWEGESFGDPYELPNDRAYAETCAAIAGAQWAWRMLLATGEVRYADQIERILLNAFLAGVSLAGDEYFYVNPLQLRVGAHAEDSRSPAHGRRGWFDCACCPPNVMRTLSSLAGYFATTGAGDDSGTPSVQVHQYASGSIAVDGLELQVDTRYPWDGCVRLTILSAPSTPVSIDVRIPGWARGATLDSSPVTAGSYARRTATWMPGQTLTLELPMLSRFTSADSRVDAVRGCVALERGPLVYALEQVDQPDGALMDEFQVEPTAPVTAEHRDDLLGGVTVLHLTGRQQDRPAAQLRSPYGDAAAQPDPQGKELMLTAIPYFAWANRGPQPMRVWLPHTRA